MSHTIELTLDADELLSQLSELAEAAKVSREVSEALFRILDSGVELIRLYGDDRPTSAGQLRIRAELADGLLQLAVAVRAGDFVRDVVEKTSHGAGVSNEC